MAINPQLAAEIKRKAAAGIELTTPTAASTALYNQYKAAPASGAASSMPKPPTAAVDTSVYGNNGSGSAALKTASNDLLRSGNADAINAAIADAQNKLNNRAGAGMDTSNQALWISKLQGALPQQQPVAVTQPQQVAMPSYGDNRAYSVGTNADRTAEAARQVAAALAEKQRIAGQQKTSLATTFANQLNDIQQNRTLENVGQARVANPFSGRTSWDQGVQNMERAEADSQLNNLYNTNVANVDAALADFQNLSITEQQRIVDQLARDDRQFGLDVAAQTGNWGENGQVRTLAGQQFDYQKGQDQIRNDAQYGGIFNGKPTADQAQQNIANQQWQQAFNAQNDQWKQEFARSGSQWKAEFDQNAKQYNQNYALQKLMTDHNITQDQAQLVISQQNADTSSASQANSQNSAYINQLMNIWEMTGVAPAGIPGVQQGTPVAQKGSTKDTIDPKESTNNYNMLMDDINQKGVDKATARRLLEANSAYLTDSDYSKFSSYINDNF
jgi:hypothetical protein